MNMTRNKGGMPNPGASFHSYPRQNIGYQTESRARSSFQKRSPELGMFQREKNSTSRSYSDIDGDDYGTS